MLRKEPQSLGDVLRLVIEENSMAARLDECRAVDLWPAIVGPQIAALTRRPTVAGGLMTVGVPSAPLRAELQMNRSTLVRLINESIGRTVLTDIRFVS